MKVFLAMFIYIAEVTYPTLQRCGKHKQSRFYKQEYKTRFGVQ